MVGDQLSNEPAFNNARIHDSIKRRSSCIVLRLYASLPSPWYRASLNLAILLAFLFYAHTNASMRLMLKP